MRKTLTNAVLLIVILALAQVTPLSTSPLVDFGSERTFRLVEFSPGNAPNFTLTVYPISQTVRIGELATYEITINSTNGFVGQVSLRNENFPQELLSEYDPAIIDLKANNHTNATLTINTISVGEEAFYQFIIIASSGSITQRASASLTVRAENAPLSTASYAFLAGVLLFTGFVVWYGLKYRRSHQGETEEISDELKPPPV